jgi:hypothetical protein
MESANTRSRLLQKITTKGSLLDIDIKLILRNKRPRSVLFMSFIFLLYGFLMFKKELIQKMGFSLPILGSIIIIGMFAGTYGRFFFAWQSGNFDGLMAQNIPFKSYLKNKFKLVALLCTVPFSIALLYAFMNYRLVFILLAAYLFCIGILPVVASYCAMSDYKRIDLSRASSFKYQGMSGQQWIHSFAISVIPMAFYLPFQLMDHQWLGVLSIGIIGLVNYLLQDIWINIFSSKFPKNKYKILEGFRIK